MIGFFWVWRSSAKWTGWVVVYNRPVKRRIWNACRFSERGCLCISTRVCGEVLSVAAVCINGNDELIRTALMSMAAYLRGLVGMVFSCFVLKVLKKGSATRGDTDCKEVFGVKKTRADGNPKNQTTHRLKHYWCVS